MECFRSSIIWKVSSTLPWVLPYLFRVFKGQVGKPAGRTAALRAEEGLRAAFADKVEGTEAGKPETGDAE